MKAAAESVVGPCRATQLPFNYSRRRTFGSGRVVLHLGGERRPAAGAAGWVAWDGTQAVLCRRERPSET